MLLVRGGIRILREVLSYHNTSLCNARETIRNITYTPCLNIFTLVFCIFLSSVKASIE